ncbi:MAG: hypothetical protein ACRERV_04520 [Methylococcales bacterium]
MRRLIRITKRLNLQAQTKNDLLQLLRDAKDAFKNDHPNAGFKALKEYEQQIQALRDKDIPTAQADHLLKRLEPIFTCVKR